MAVIDDMTWQDLERQGDRTPQARRLPEASGSGDLAADSPGRPVRHAGAAAGGRHPPGVPDHRRWAGAGLPPSAGCRPRG